MPRLSGPEFFVEALSAYGVTHCFYVPVVISEAMKLMPDKGITAVMTHGEKAAAYMADGYARISGKVGVCAAQAIGATNLAAGLRDAYLARIPVLAISGGMNVASRYRHFYQEIDDMPIYDHLTKFNARIEDASRMPDLLAQAFRAATTGMPQPVHLELDGLWHEQSMQPIEHDLSFEARYARYPAIRQPALAEDVARALTAIEKAKRPVIVAGGGVVSSRAAAYLVDFARRHAIPVAKSLNAKDVMLDTDPLSLGVVGQYSATSANAAVSQADLVIYIGSLTGGLVTRNRKVPSPETAVVHIDINPENIGRNYPNTVGVCGDAATVLQQLLAVGARFKAPDEWITRTSEFKAEWDKQVRPMETSDAVPMRPERLLHDLSGVLPSNAIVVGDTGHSGAWIAQNLKVTSESQRVIRAHGSLGWALPASMGAKAARPDCPVICFTGDGGFMYHMAELETAVRYGLNTITVVNNNAALNQEAHIWDWNEKWANNWRFAPVDYGYIAKAFGVGYAKVEKPGQLERAMSEALSASKPFLIEGLTDIEAMASRAYGE